MANLLRSFTGRDYTAELERLLAMLKYELEQYTDYNHADPGICFIRWLSRETDQLNFYIDQVYQEGFIRSARFKQSLIEIGLVVGFLPTLWAAATTRFRFNRKDGVSGAIPFPKYTPFTRDDGMSYLTTDAVVMQDGADSVEVNAMQGELVEFSLEPSELNVVDLTNRPQANLGPGVVASTVEVWEGDPAIPWTQVEWHWRSFPTDRHYVLILDGDSDYVWLTLGDGTKGTDLPADTLHVRFVKTAGTSGNCGHSTITGVPEEFADLITCTNIEPATGGAPSEGTESIRRSIPLVTRAQRRAVITDDYEALLEHQAGVLHCRAFDRNEFPSTLAERFWGSADYFCPFGYMVLIIVPEGGGPVSSALKQQLWIELGKWGHKGPWSGRYLLYDALEKPVNVSMRIGVAAGSTPEAATSAAVTAVTDLLAVQNRTIGERLKFSDLHSTASAATGVEWVEFNTPNEDEVPNAGEIIVPGTVTAVAA